jgi:hypothetical protein
MMSDLASRRTPCGQSLFTRYALPPNELGYCGPADADPSDIAAHAREFDGAWPYLTAIADAVGTSDPLDADVVENYWVGGPLLARVDRSALLARLRHCFEGQVTGLLADIPDTARVLPHHSFHVFVVYPWIRFLDRDASTALHVLQNCRIRWGVVESVDEKDVVLRSRPLTMDRGMLVLGEAAPERVSRDDAAPPRPGQTVSAHWHRVCHTLTDPQTAALAAATQSTLDVVNAARMSAHQPNPP